MDKLPDCYLYMSKKKLRESLLINMDANIKIAWENHFLDLEVDRLNDQIKVFENAISYKDRVIENYKYLLDHAVGILS